MGTMGYFPGGKAAGA